MCAWELDVWVEHCSSGLNALVRHYRFIWQRAFVLHCMINSQNRINIYASHPQKPFRFTLTWFIFSFFRSAAKHTQKWAIFKKYFLNYITIWGRSSKQTVRERSKQTRENNNKQFTKSLRKSSWEYLENFPGKSQDPEAFVLLCCAYLVLPSATS